MKRIYHVLFVIAIIIISFKCQKESSGNTINNTQSNSQSSPIKATLQGNVLDEYGQPAAGVKISAGLKTSTTDAYGYFSLEDAALDKNAALAIAEKPGYFKAFRSFRATVGANRVVIKLIKKTLAGTVNAVTGGEVTLSNGTKILLTANSVTKASGGSYAGNIEMYADYIDPTARDISASMPGSFMADDKDKNRVVLSSYGMLAVELQSPAGEKLQIISGNTATLTIPIPLSLLSSSPAAISLWYVDENTGIWKEEGNAKKNGTSYVGVVKHFSFWNSDVSFPSVSFTVTLKTADNLFIKNTLVRISAASDTAKNYAYGYTDSLGQVSGLVPANTNLLLDVMSQCYNIAWSKNIGPFAQNTNLATIVVPNTASSLVTITGKLISCSNTPVTNGYAAVYFNNSSYFVRVDSKGAFVLQIINCSASAQAFEIAGVDENRQQQSSTLTIPLTGSVTDAGTISACGISSLRYINYTLDGADYSTTDSTLYANSYPASAALFNTYIGCNTIRFDFTNDPVAGDFPLYSLEVLTYKRIRVTQPLNVALTAFPKKSGDFYTGSFSGNFIDSAAITVTHNISCTFRIKKY